MTQIAGAVVSAAVGSNAKDLDPSSFRCIDTVPFAGNAVLAGGTVVGFLFAGPIAGPAIGAVGVVVLACNITYQTYSKCFGENRELHKLATTLEKENGEFQQTKREVGETTQLLSGVEQGLHADAATYQSNVEAGAAANGNLASNVASLGDTAKKIVEALARIQKEREELQAANQQSKDLHKQQLATLQAEANAVQGDAAKLAALNEKFTQASAALSANEKTLFEQRDQLQKEVAALAQEVEEKKLLVAQLEQERAALEQLSKSLDEKQQQERTLLDQLSAQSKEIGSQLTSPELGGADAAFARYQSLLSPASAASSLQIQQGDPP